MPVREELLLVEPDSLLGRPEAGRSWLRRVARGRGESAGGNNSEDWAATGILLFSPGLFRDILESVLGDRVEDLLDLGSSRHQFGQNSLHGYFRSLSARAARM